MCKYLYMGSIIKLFSDPVLLRTSGDGFYCFFSIGGFYDPTLLISYLAFGTSNSVVILYGVGLRATWRLWESEQQPRASTA